MCFPGLPWSKITHIVDSVMPASTSSTQTGLQHLAAAWVGSGCHLSVQLLSEAFLIPSYIVTLRL